MKHLPILIALALAAAVFGKSLVVPTEDARRLNILFFGAPTAHHPGHDPVTRYRVIKKHLGTEGIDFNYTEDPAEAFNPTTLAQHDAILMYGNWHQNGQLPAEQKQALFQYIEQGGGFLPIHMASACYGGSPDFVKLVGAKFRSHGGEVFKPETVNRTHPITQGYQSFEAWDETYEHSDHNDDRVVLQKRGNEPWTWVRTHGKGRVFYTASGHDHRVWDTPEFHDLLKRAIFWSVGDEAKGRLDALQLPELKFEKAQLPGYRERKTIEQYQAPLRPEESLKLAQVPPGFELSLFASDPDIVNPIAINWDEKGRAYVLETIDYPNNLQANNIGHDRLTICEDTDGDGRADKFTRFAEKLSIPTSIEFAADGVICTNGSEMLFLKDTNGDDKADVRKILFQGFNMGDTHAGVSNLKAAPDGWIYATIGYSGFRGLINGQQESFGMGIFRFRLTADPASTEVGADGTLQEIVEYEYIQPTTNNTWGLDFTADFDIFASTANGNPSAYVTFPKRDYDAVGLEQPRTPRADFKDPFNPSSTDIRQVENHDTYTSAAGHAFYKARNFPEAYWDKIFFVCGPTGKLVGQFEIVKDGSGFRSHQLRNNIYNSADAWSAPVAAEVGPDGALWVCDWYNIIVQHNPTPSEGSAGYNARNGRGNAYVTPLRDKEHGRIYRITAKGRELAGEPQNDVYDFLASEPTLESITAALKSDNPGLRRAALRIAPLDGTLSELFLSEGRIAEKDPRTLVELLLAFSRLAPSQEIVQAILALEVDPNDVGLRDAREVALRKHASAALLQLASTWQPQEQTARNILANADLEKQGDWGPRIYGGNRNPKHRHLNAQGRDKSGCLSITSEQPADTGWGLTVSVRPNTTYEFGGFVKTENLSVQNGPGVLFNIHGGPQTSSVREKDSDWTELTGTFTTGRDQREVLMHCLFGGYGSATGTAYYDDLYIREVSRDDTGNLVRNLVRYFAQNSTAAQFDELMAGLKADGGSAARVIATQLQNAPRREVEVTRKNTIDPAIHKRGKEIYDKTCIACHGPDGKGVAGAFPPLDGSEWVTGDPAPILKVLLHGLQGPIEVKGETYTNIMPPHVFSDQEMADVATYIRQTWSNDAPAVTEEEAAKVRAATKERKTPWTAPELN
ncbi:PVC-type heme-binding CxxCH protein [Roseibacillus ishigakijimensis]|uniref:ThuA domain-containing protein n=1 Tax=Roseibacillus ishigakijimensis TaxID=454146 RepID=A0A934RUF6_9BACT|nr:PVC-type heme-binding CxxCH protein [Roseibacillus ishigakijimensis]MBK1835618.1 ThuA domain-containing protein [Roseibacillus ishigakijimensis]